jgi:hypothetical protein
VNNNKKVIVLTLIFIFLSAIYVYWFKPAIANYILLRNVLYLLTPLASVVGGFYSLNIFGYSGGRAKTILYLTLGVLCWFIGEVLFAYFEVIAHTDAFPSIADVFYLFAYPLFFVGLLNELKLARVKLQTLHTSTKFLMGTISFLLICVVFYLIIYLGYDSTATLFANSIAAAYGVGDIILIITNMFILVLAWEFKGGKLSNTWMTIFTAFMAIFLADILYAVYTQDYLSDVYIFRNVIDSLFMLGYILLGLGLFDFGLSSQLIFTALKTSSTKK